MAKLAFLAALLVALVALGKVSAHHTTITTTTVDEDDTTNQQSQRCREQMQRQQNLSQCQMYLQSQSGSGGNDMAVMNQQGQQHLRQCCQQLENMDEQCRCQGLRMLMRRQQQEGQMEREEMREMMQEAQELPNRCNMRPRRCQMQNSLVFDDASVY